MTDRKRIIASVFTDASFCHRTKAAGFAVWIKTDAVTLRHAGAFKIAIDTAQQAETAALANGICAALSRLDMQAGDMIVAASDCLRAIDIIEGRGTGISKGMQKVRNHVRKQLRERSVELRLKHVKAHQGVNAGPRHAVNEWCDGAAKTVMRAQRADRSTFRLESVPEEVRS